MEGANAAWLNSVDKLTEKPHSPPKWDVLQHDVGMHEAVQSGRLSQFVVRLEERDVIYIKVSGINACLFQHGGGDVHAVHPLSVPGKGNG